MVGYIEGLIQAINRVLVYIQIWEFQQSPPIPDLYAVKERELQILWEQQESKEAWRLFCLSVYKIVTHWWRWEAPARCRSCLYRGPPKSIWLFLPKQMFPSRIWKKKLFSIEKHTKRSWFITGRIHFIRSPLFTEAPWYTKLFWTRSFDYLYFVTDGSLFFSLAGRNLLHIQTPLLLQNHSWTFKLKSSQWQKLIPILNLPSRLLKNTGNLR